jgi:hypothetical protein
MLELPPSLPAEESLELLPPSSEPLSEADRCPELVPLPPPHAQITTAKTAKVAANLQDRVRGFRTCKISSERMVDKLWALKPQRDHQCWSGDRHHVPRIQKCASRANAGRFGGTRGVPGASPLLRSDESAHRAQKTLCAELFACPGHCRNVCTSRNLAGSVPISRPVVCRSPRHRKTLLRPRPIRPFLRRGILRPRHLRRRLGGHRSRRLTVRRSRRLTRAPVLSGESTRRRRT